LTPLKQKELSVVDTHTVGEPTRIVTSPPKVRGATMVEIRNEMEANHDWIRRLLLREPRGHSDMFGAVLFSPRRKECDLGVVFMNNRGFSYICGHGIIGVITCAVETGIIKPEPEILVDTPAGIVKARVEYRRRRVRSVSFENVPAFRLGTTEIVLAGQTISVDIAFGGNLFAHVYANKVGITIEPKQKTAILDLAIKIRDALNKQEKITLPGQSKISKVELVQFSGPPKSEGAHAQNVVVFGLGQIDRSPCGTGTCAKMALLHSEGKLGLGDWFIHESIIGTKFKGRLLDETKVGKYDAVLPEITGSAYITGFNRLILREDDPFPEGFLL